MHRLRKTYLSLMTTLTVGGSCFAVGGCDALSTAFSALKDYNPCGTILACDPAEYEFLTSGIDGPGVRPDIDPFCVYPPFCDADVDPIFGGLTGQP